VVGCLIKGQFYVYFAGRGARPEHQVGRARSIYCIALCGLLRTALNPPIRFPDLCGVGRGVAADIRCVQLRKHPSTEAKVNKWTSTYAHSLCVCLSSYNKALFLAIMNVFFQSDVCQKDACGLARAVLPNTWWLFSKDISVRDNLRKLCYNRVQKGSTRFVYVLLRAKYILKKSWLVGVFLKITVAM
jgi:hypothetical protein